MLFGKELLDEGIVVRGRPAADDAVGAVFLGHAVAKVPGLHGARPGLARAPRMGGVLSLSGRGGCFPLGGSRLGLERWVGDDEGTPQPVRGRRVEVGARRGGEGLEFGLVGLEVGLLELRGEPHEGPVVAEDEGGVAEEVNVVLNAFGLGALGLFLDAFEGGVDQYWEGSVGDGAALRPTGRSLAEKLEAVVGVVFWGAEKVKL